MRPLDTPYPNDHTCIRLATHAAAVLLRDKLNAITTGLRFRAVFDKAEDHDLQRGVGSYAVVHDEINKNWIENSSAVNRAIDQAKELILVDALRELQPDHSLIQSWWQKPENQTTNKINIC